MFLSIFGWFRDHIGPSCGFSQGQGTLSISTPEIANPKCSQNLGAFLLLEHF
jgi:hypothetical protein